MIDPGQLNRRIALEAPTETPDGARGVTRAYATVATFWAEVTPLAARSDVDAARAGAVASYRVIARAGRDITTRHRLRFGARFLEVVSVRDHDAAGRYLAIHAEERRD